MKKCMQMLIVLIGISRWGANDGRAGMVAALGPCANREIAAS